jgi:uncharacterized protein YneF (UPF0154 family)
MDYTNNQQNMLNEFDQPKQLPTMLNVLTILTFVGSALGLFSLLAMPTMCKLMDKLSDNPAMTEKATEAMSKMCGNLTLMIIYSAVGIALCLFGAIQMRKRMKSGFYLYLAGTFLPIILNIVLNGISSVTYDSKTLIATVLGALLFPILYYTQFKELTK